MREFSHFFHRDGTTTYDFSRSKLFDDFDILLVEGLKNLPLPRISVFRNHIDSDYIPYMDALATDYSINTQNYDLSDDIDILDLNNINEVISWILNNAKKV